MMATSRRVQTSVPEADGKVVPWRIRAYIAEVSFLRMGEILYPELAAGLSDSPVSGKIRKWDTGGMEPTPALMLTGFPGK